MDNYNKKYNFKVSMNQFGHPQNADFFDESELVLIDYFEKICLDLKKENKTDYSILELGANQCYYTIMFNSILNKEYVKSFVLEPNDEGRKRAIHELSLNDISYTMIPKSIGTHWIAHNREFDIPNTTVDEIIKEFNILNLDVLHADIDGAEEIMLNTSIESLTKKIINYLIVLTHNDEVHAKCKDFIKKYNYDIVVDHESSYIGADHLIIAKR